MPSATTCTSGSMGSSRRSHRCRPGSCLAGLLNRQRQLDPLPPRQRSSAEPIAKPRILRPRNGPLTISTTREQAFGQQSAMPRENRMETARELYRSSNGDRWLLVRAAVDGEVFVRHMPNAASGGQSSDIDIGDFGTVVE